jgi:Matrixin
LRRIATRGSSKGHLVLVVISSCFAGGCASSSQPIVASPLQQGSLVVVSHDNGAEPSASRAVTAGERAYHWSRPGALRMYVQPSSALAGWSPRHLELVDEAIKAWMSRGEVEIGVVSWPRDADIRLYWTDRLPSTNPGVTMLYRSLTGQLTRADMFIDVQPAPWHTGTPDRVLYATIAHELGHALGLPHDPSPAALMHPAPLVTRVTDIDQTRLRALLIGR